MNAPTIHPFEEAGLGLAPFKFLGMREERGPITTVLDGLTVQVGAPGQPMGSCKYCGQGIAYVCYVLSADGKRFTVGSDCVMKLAKASNVGMTDLERAVAREMKKVRAAKNAKRAESAREKLAARIEAASAALDANPALLTD